MSTTTLPRIELAVPVVAWTIGMKTPSTSAVISTVSTAAVDGAALRLSDRNASFRKKPTRISWGSPYMAIGEFVEVDPPSRIAWTWGWENDGMSTPPGSSMVEMTLTPSAGGTHVRLVHSGLPSREAAEAHSHGWDQYMPRLAIAATGGDPGTDPNANATMEEQS